jgi:hypothetical protein
VPIRVLCIPVGLHRTTVLQATDAGYTDQAILQTGPATSPQRQACPCRWISASRIHARLHLESCPKQSTRRPFATLLTDRAALSVCQESMMRRSAGCQRGFMGRVRPASGPPPAGDNFDVIIANV